MPLCIIYSKSDGKIHSIGNVDLSSLPDEYGATIIQEWPDFTKQPWDPTTYELTPEPSYSLEVTDVFGEKHVVPLDHQPTDQDTFDALHPNFTKLQFRRLLTLSERIVLDGIETSAAPENVKATVHTIKEDFAAAQYISLEDPITVQAINAFEQMGLIATGRAAQILAGQIPV